ncbi:MAG: hypothetical protein KY458_03355 [Actinobacteria bacterium]|nr:hypothetical protein [Actinomycetota bacterium]
MEPRFELRSDGIVDCLLDGRSLLNEALADAVSSRAPRGALHPGLSTYWIDRTEEAVRRAVQHRLQEPFATGNVTYLSLKGDLVVAAYDFDGEDGQTESIPVDEFVHILTLWRQEVVGAGGVSGDDAAALQDEPRARPMPPASE